MTLLVTELYDNWQPMIFPLKKGFIFEEKVTGLDCMIGLGFSPYYQHPTAISSQTIRYGIKFDEKCKKSEPLLFTALNWCVFISSFSIELNFLRPC